MESLNRDLNCYTKSLKKKVIKNSTFVSFYLNQTKNHLKNKSLQTKTKLKIKQIK